ncbi:hypothetical protein HOY80DRAFT_1033957 [Tuber brumale]|nr:hypothetical protein HOY80DRAFT_1033957 [Tuber brumale]
MLDHKYNRAPIGRKKRGQGEGEGDEIVRSDTQRQSNVEGDDVDRYGARGTEEYQLPESKFAGCSTFEEGVNASRARPTGDDSSSGRE